MRRCGALKKWWTHLLCLTVFGVESELVCQGRGPMSVRSPFGHACGQCVNLHDTVHFFLGQQPALEN